MSDLFKHKMNCNWSVTVCREHGHSPEAVKLHAFGYDGSTPPGFFAHMCDNRDICSVTLCYTGCDNGRGWIVDPALMARLSSSTQLTSLCLTGCIFTETVTFPMSLTKLQLNGCSFNRGWNVGEFVALPNLDTLETDHWYFADFLLTSVHLDRIRVLSLTSRVDLSLETTKQIGDVLRSGTLEELTLVCSTRALWFKGYLLPEIARSNLKKLTFWYASVEADKLKWKFDRRIKLLTLLLARKPHRRLRKLPVEMFRLVGQMLI